LKQIGPRPSVTALQQPRRRSRSKSPRPTDALKRSYSVSVAKRLNPRTGPRVQAARPSADSSNVRRRYSTIHTGPEALGGRGRQLPSYLPQPEATTSQDSSADDRSDYPVPLFTAVSAARAGDQQALMFRNAHKARLARRAYLRHSFNRMDFIAVVAFWIALALQLTVVTTSHHIYVFRMLSCLRIFRLLSITEGMSVRC
jgi:Ion transport protein